MSIINQINKFIQSSYEIEEYCKTFDISSEDLLSFYNELPESTETEINYINKIISDYKLYPERENEPLEYHEWQFWYLIFQILPPNSLQCIYEFEGCFGRITRLFWYKDHIGVIYEITTQDDIYDILSIHRLLD